MKLPDDSRYLSHCIYNVVTKNTQNYDFENNIVILVLRFLVFIDMRTNLFIDIAVTPVEELITAGILNQG